MIFFGGGWCGSISELFILYSQLEMYTSAIEAETV